MTFNFYTDIFGFSLLQRFNSLSYRFYLEIGRNGTSVDKPRLSFDFSDYLTQVNRFFNPMIKWLAATGNLRRQRLFESLLVLLQVFFFLSAKHFLSSSGEILHFVSNFLENRYSCMPGIFSLLQ